MIKKLLSLFAIATLTSFAAHADEEVKNAPLIIEEAVVADQNANLLASAEKVIVEEKDAEEADLADCGCGRKYKKRKRGKDDALEMTAAAPKLAANDAAEESDEEILPPEGQEKLASCCQGACPAAETTAPVVEEEEVEETKLA